MRLNAAALLLCGLAACTSGPGTGSPPDAGNTCVTARDCIQTPPHVCVDLGGTTADGGAAPKVCVLVCSKNADCASGLVCEDGTCTAPGCGGNSDCTGGQICQSGNCTSPVQASTVGSCDVSPSPGVVHAGTTLQLIAIVRDTNGIAVPFKGVTWAATGPGTVDANTGLVTGTAPSAGDTGVITVTATAGGKTCTSAITSYGAAANFRVVAMDAHTKKPIQGAFVLLDSDASVAANKSTTDANGIATFTGVAAGAHDVHVFAANYNYTSYIGTTATDLLVTLPPYVALAQRSGFSGTITTDDFAKLTEKDQIVHLAFFGSGVSNSILDFSLDTLLGPLRHVVIELAGEHPVDLPSGLVLGVGDNMFGTSDYKMYADPGRRVLWGLGGNVDIAAVLKAAGPLLQGGTANIDVGALLPQLLPLLGALEAGAVVGVQPAANVAVGTTPTFTPDAVTLNTPLRLRATPVAPDLPKVDGVYVDGVIVLAGSAAYPMGFVPLGLTAGLAAKDQAGNKTAKVLDPTCDATVTTNNCATSNLPLKLAAQNNGLEGNQYGIVLLALNFGGLTPGSTTGVAVSGLVKLQSEVAFTAGDTPAPVISFGSRPFVALPDTGVITFSKGTRKLVLNSDADAAVQIYRFELENAARMDWNIWMDKAGASGRQVTLINPHDLDPSLLDPMADIVPQEGGDPKGASGRMVTIITSDPAANYTSLTGFGNITLDNIGNSLSAFSVIQVDLGN